MQTIEVTIPETVISMQVPDDIGKFVEIVQACNKGKRVTAIRLTRRCFGNTLKEAKEYVDNLNTTESILLIKKLKDDHPEYFL